VVDVHPLMLHAVSAIIPIKRIAASFCFIPYPPFFRLAQPAPSFFKLDNILSITISVALTNACHARAQKSLNYKEDGSYANRQLKHTRFHSCK
jgi:hypothetical protein